MIGYIPYFGKPMNFLLLSLMYAYYCFEYVHLNVFKHSFNSLCLIHLPGYFIVVNLFKLFLSGTSGTSLQ